MQQTSKEMAKKSESDNGEEEPQKERVTVPNAQIKHFLECWQGIKETPAFHSDIEETVKHQLFRIQHRGLFYKAVNEKTAMWPIL